MSLSHAPCAEHATFADVYVDTTPSLFADTRIYPKGLLLLRQDSHLAEVWYLVKGIVKLTQINSVGGESIVELALPGDWIGTAAAMANRPSPVGALTCGAAVLSRSPATTFRHHLSIDSTLSHQISAAHALQLCHQVSRIGQLCSLNSKERLRDLICRFAAKATVLGIGHSQRFKLPLQQKEIAEFVGVTPEHLCRLMRELERAGSFRRESGGFLVTGERRPLREVTTRRIENRS